MFTVRLRLRRASEVGPESARLNLAQEMQMRSKNKCVCVCVGDRQAPLQQSPFIKIGDMREMANNYSKIKKKRKRMLGESFWKELVQF